ncbi:MAG: hypothetical protein SNG27_01305 [Rikenellaceae bacterium]
MKYFLRAIKYLLSLCILYFAVIYAMYAFGLSALPPEQTLAILVGSSRGWIMIVAVLALSFSYPVFGFMKQEVSGDIVANRDQIIAAFAANGFSLKSSSQGEMIFESDNLIKKITFLFEDRITVAQVGDKLVVEGIRRAVPFVIYRLEGMISFSDKK